MVNLVKGFLEIQVHQVTVAAILQALQDLVVLLQKLTQGGASVESTMLPRAQEALGLHEVHQGTANHPLQDLGDV